MSTEQIISHADYGMLTEIDDSETAIKYHFAEEGCKTFTELAQDIYDYGDLSLITLEPVELYSLLDLNLFVAELLKSNSDPTKSIVFMEEMDGLYLECYEDFDIDLVNRLLGDEIELFKITKTEAIATPDQLTKALLDLEFPV